MIESQNPEINVQELMARIRAEVERRRALSPVSPGAPPPKPATGTPESVAPPSNALRTNITEALDRARQKLHVSSRIPAVLRPFFRNRGDFNFRLLRVIELQVQQIDALRDELTHLQQATRSDAADLRTALVDSRTQIDTLAAEISKQVSELHGILTEQQVQHDSARQQVREFESRLADLINHVAPKITSLDADAFYLAFENQFRGTRDDIKERSRIYLPYLAEAGVGTADKPLLDLGCGRGEWLELLRENGYVARGVDSNASMLSICRGLEMDVIAADALSYLKSLPDQSQGAVTGIHLIEHLPFPVLMELFAQTFRVVRKGGVVIFETPNPNNIQVGASRFYLDPTHVHPLPPAMTQFLIEAFGPARVEILELRPFSPDHLVQDDNQVIINRFNQFFYGPQDYAVIARTSG
jgi:SAM-dependent methyltransferase